MRRPGGRGDVPGQLQIDWTAPAGATDKTPAAALPASRPAGPSPAPLIQRLPWDFKETFPQPTPEALEAGIVSDEDAEPENVRAIHDEHARELLAVLHDLDAVLDARRRGVDPATGRVPTTPAARERLQKLFANEPQRLERWWRTQMDTYESAFGAEAADAFDKAIRARHAGIAVEIEERPSLPAARPTAAAAQPAGGTPSTAAVDAPSIKRQKRRSHSRLPIADPLPAAVAAGRFGRDEHGPITPGLTQVRTLTENLADTLIELLGGLSEVESWLNSPQCSDQARLYHEKDRLMTQIRGNLARYGEVFGTEAAGQLEAYVQREARRISPTDARENLLPGVPANARTHGPKRTVAILPVPKPLSEAVAAGRFGQDEQGRPIRPCPAEVRAITEQHAEKLIDLLDAIASAPSNGKDALLESFQNGIAAYAEDFGKHAAQQLEAYVRREVGRDRHDFSNPTRSR